MQEINWVLLLVIRKLLRILKTKKVNLNHQEAQAKGKNKWYSWYKVRICNVKWEYEFGD